ncbi:MAG: DUF4115 domain-containing protein [Gammaproteobacteria bacterium]|nr:DUF4115 domain-containing protein [Gammaproteobacteria bacterium]
MADENNEDTQIDTPLSVGDRLKQAREGKNFSIAEVSAQLRLMKDNINALETGQWSMLHGRAYARGYFSSYVKLLGLPEDELLAAFNREYESTASDSSLSNVANLKEPKVFPWGRLVLVIVLFVITWFAYQQWLNYEKELDIDVNNQSSELNPPSSQSFSGSVVEPISEPVELNSLNHHDYEPTLVEEVLEVAQEAAVSEQHVADVEPQVIEESTVPMVEDKVRENDLLVDTMAVALQETHIALQFSQDCWVKVSDTDTQVLINKLMKANTRLELTGKPPLSLSLGRASAVNLKVNDKEFDLSSYIQGDVAKFTVGNES